MHKWHKSCDPPSMVVFNTFLWVQVLIKRVGPTMFAHSAMNSDTNDGKSTMHDFILTDVR